ncbi:MAG TPA: NADH-quinone oxidoreductase subunit L [Casimicrobiaceae bacterium]|nr:NADH-quinone oxidoreductase subunit L [Casimicrobiaceae bacterium]
MTHALTLIVLLPLIGFAFNGAVSMRARTGATAKSLVTLVGCALPIAAFLLSIKTFLDLRAGGYAPIVDIVYNWAVIGDSSFEVAFYFDRLAAVMALIVTGVGSLIHVYTIGYMKDDDGYARFFAYLNLFLVFMLLLVLGRSLLVLFVGWEGVGLASYLLIGFWYEDPRNAEAGKKAFITNRIGDAGFLLGMFVLYATFGTFDMDRINLALAGGPVAVSATLVGVLLFIGASGKSAQIPLHVWLPDAMAGPTPISALIHAATMVTAGVYLVARMSMVYVQSSDASLVVTTIGAATAFFAATVAVTQTDIKRVLAYSTVSQLGLMFVAAGVGAYGVAIFHVYTHAFFKACLFLGAGSVIHALSGEQDIRKMGGIARKIPWTFVTFAIATASIAGIPPLAGFWSKDEILWFALASSRGGATALWLAASAASLLTAFYMFRLLWLVFLGNSRVAPEVEHHIHESPWSMRGVLVVLAVLSAVGGFVSIPHFLEPQLALPEVRLPETSEHLVVYVSVALALGGLAGAAWIYASGPERAEAIRAKFAGLHRVLYNKYFVDELYQRVIARPLLWISDRVVLRFGDRWLLDGSLNGMARLAQRGAGALSRLQDGSLQRYALLVLFGATLCLIWIWRHV